MVYLLKSLFFVYISRNSKQRCKLILMHLHYTIRLSVRDHELFCPRNPPWAERRDQISQVTAQKLLPLTLCTAQIHHQIRIGTVEQQGQLGGHYVGVISYSIFDKMCFPGLIRIQVTDAWTVPKLYNSSRYTPFTHHIIGCGDCQMRCPDSTVYAVKSYGFSLFFPFSDRKNTFSPPLFFLQQFKKLPLFYR